MRRSSLETVKVVQPCLWYPGDSFLPLAHKAWAIDDEGKDSARKIVTVQQC